MALDGNMKVGGVRPVARSATELVKPAAGRPKIDTFQRVAGKGNAGTPTAASLVSTSAARYYTPTSSASWDRVCGIVVARNGADLSAIRPAVVSELEAQLREVLS